MNFNYYDITAQPINVNDIVVIDTPEHRHVLKVLEIVGSVEDMRKVKCRRIRSSDPDASADFSLTLIPGQPVMGCVVPEANAEESDDFLLVTFGERNNIIVSELRLLLSRLKTEGFRTRFVDVVKAFIEVGFLPRDEKAAKALLSKVLKANKDIFQSHGSWVKLVEQEPQHSVNLGQTLNPTRTVNLTHLNLALEHLLLSGLFGDVKIDVSPIAK